MARRTIAGLRGILTGASSGIGRELTLQLVSQGARLVAVARRTDRLEALSAELKHAPGELVLLAGDVTLPEVRQQAMDLAGSTYGGLDLLVNNAGIGAMGNFIEATPQRLRAVMEVNFFAAAELARLAVPLLRQGQRPMIVNVSSVLGHRGVPGCAEYCASKFALQGLSESLRAELAPLGVDLLVVSPGTTSTEFFERSIDAADPKWPRLQGMSSEAVARRIVRAIARGKREIVISGGGHFIYWANRLAPRIVDRILARYG